MNLNQTIEETTMPCMNAITERERQILYLIFDEKTNREIGVELGISSRTVDRHRENICKKLHVKTTVGLVKIAYKYLVE